MSGFFVSTKMAIVIGSLFVVIVVGVGLMAGLIPQKSYTGEPAEPQPTTPSTPTTPATQPPEEEGPWIGRLLPDSVKPTHFDLWFYPDFYFDGNTFTGRETVHLNVTESTHYIIIHIKMMDITGTAVLDTNQRSLTVVRAFPYEANQYWVVEMAEELTAGSQVQLQLNFTGSLTAGIVGYYKSTYVNADTGLESWLATTKFQPADARKAFPNFDEPRFKSTFDITLRHWKNFTALSNMPEYEAGTVDIDDVWRETKFPRTPVMSAYLVAFIVCDFNYTRSDIVSPTRGSITHRVWAAPDRVNQTQYALSAGKVMSEAFETKFAMPHQLPKLDHMAVPDYPSGATEHWGMMTYREARLLYDAEQVGDSDKQRVATIVAHEIAHNYFGNVITCYWWDEIWLNEGFARFYEGRAVDVFEPEMGLEAQLLVNTVQTVMATDAGGSSRPVVVPINDPDEANAAFDSITYSKGAAMLRMMEDFVGEVTWEGAIQRYLRENAYGSVTTQDLWDAVQAEVGEGEEPDISRIMTPWVSQMGLPVIDLSVSSNKIIASQKRFLNDPDANSSLPESPYNYQWEVPLSYFTSEGDSNQVWIKEETVEFPNPASGDEWVKFNRRQAGYYRVNYWPAMWTRLSAALKSDFTVFPDLERASLLDDALSLARAGQLDYPLALAISQYLGAETEYAPWRTARNTMGYIGDMLYGHMDYGLWRTFMQNITSPLMEQLGVSDGGSHLEKLTRTSIISLSCGNGHVACLENTTRLFLAWVEDEIAGAVPTNIRSTVYEWGMYATGGDREFDVLWSRYGTTTSGQEKNNILYALTRTKNLWLIQRLLDYSGDTSKIREQDFFSLIGNIASNKMAINHLWDWVRENYDDLILRFGTQNRSFSWMVPGMVARFNTEFKLQEVIDFYAKYSEAGPGERRREESIDSIRNNIGWKIRSQDAIFDWLRV